MKKKRTVLTPEEDDFENFNNDKNCLCPPIPPHIKRQQMNGPSSVHLCSFTLLSLLLVSPSVNAAAANGTAARQYQVVRTQLDTDEQLRLLEMLEMKGADLEFNFWTSPVRVGSSVDVMLPVDKVFILQRYLQKHRMHSEVIIEDVERLIIQRERKVFQKEGDDKPSNRFMADDPIRRATANMATNSEPKFDFYHYNSYAQMVAWMRALARRHSKLVQFITIGKTHEGRGIDGLEIGSRGFRKRAFWIDGGIHAREWAAPHTALYFIHLLTSRYGKDAEITRLVDELTWVIVPLLNPDGYEFTRSSTHPNVRLWRKNRSPTHCVRDQWGRNRCCKGVDLNRNFDFHFKESGSSDDPCSEIYQGTYAFSEPESRPEMFLLSFFEQILSHKFWQFIRTLSDPFETRCCPTVTGAALTGSSPCTRTPKFGYTPTGIKGKYGACQRCTFPCLKYGTRNKNHANHKMRNQRNHINTPWRHTPYLSPLRLQ
ncbi:hypothetical protein GPALN_003518 [Globodera pallida]|nr:hypothetical protein GPALN_003518 [Globodera pallida]